MSSATRSLRLRHYFIRLRYYGVTAGRAYSAARLLLASPKCLPDSDMLGVALWARNLSPSQTRELATVAR
jgi:hypothetical protein